MQLPDYITIPARRLVARDIVQLHSTDHRVTDVYIVRGNVNADTDTGLNLSWRPDDEVRVHRQTHGVLTAVSVSTLDTERLR